MAPRAHTLAAASVLPCAPRIFPRKCFSPRAVVASADNQMHILTLHVPTGDLTALFKLRLSASFLGGCFFIGTRVVAVAQYVHFHKTLKSVLTQNRRDTNLNRRRLPPQRRARVLARGAPRRARARRCRSLARGGSEGVAARRRGERSDGLPPPISPTYTHSHTRSRAHFVPLSTLCVVLLGVRHPRRRLRAERARSLPAAARGAHRCGGGRRRRRCRRWR